MTRQWIVQLEKGIITYEKQEEYTQWLSQKKDGKYAITLTKPKSIRSLEQNNLYWVYLEIIEKDTGTNRMAAHEYFKRKLLKPIFSEAFGVIFKKPRSTTSLSMKEFAKYMQAIELKTEIPIPNVEDLYL